MNDFISNPHLKPFFSSWNPRSSLNMAHVDHMHLRHVHDPPKSLHSAAGYGGTEPGRFHIRRRRTWMFNKRQQLNGQLVRAAQRATDDRSGCKWIKIR